MTGVWPAPKRGCRQGWHQPSKELTAQVARQSYLPLLLPSSSGPFSEQSDKPLAQSSWLVLVSFSFVPWGPCLPGEWTAFWVASLLERQLYPVVLPFMAHLKPGDFKKDDHMAW